MKKVTIMILSALLCACGTTSSLRGDQQTDFVLISVSKAGGAYKLIRGETAACKLTTHGVTGLEYTINFDGSTCEAMAGK